MNQPAEDRRAATEEELRLVAEMLSFGYESQDIEARLLQRALAPDVAKALVEYVNSLKRTKRPASRASFTTILAVMFFIGGVILYFGNISGLFPTFPYAGFLAMLIGGALLWLGGD